MTVLVFCWKGCWLCWCFVWKAPPHRLCWSLFENNGPSQTMLVFVENSPPQPFAGSSQKFTFFQYFCENFYFQCHIYSAWKNIASKLLKIYGSFRQNCSLIRKVVNSSAETMQELRVNAQKNRFVRKTPAILTAGVTVLRSKLKKTTNDP